VIEAIVRFLDEDLASSSCIPPQNELEIDHKYNLICMSNQQPNKHGKVYRIHQNVP